MEDITNDRTATQDTPLTQVFLWEFKLQRNGKEMYIYEHFSAGKLGAS